MSTALIIDDEADLCRLMQMTLQKMQIASVVAHDVSTAIRYLSEQSFDFCLTDLRLPDGSGLDIVKLINQHYPTTPVAVITAHGSIDLAIDALKLGAFDFVNKPLELSRLRQIVKNALTAAADAKRLPAPCTPDPFMGKLIGESPAIKQLRQTITKLARSQAPVFLCGESGTGKEVVATLIHELSPRSQANFVAVNCGAISFDLMESEFFGHKKGSFTGATNDKDGLFQQADGGTLFLDEIADLPLAMQVKLLRAIQEKKIRPVGSTQEIAVDIRIVSATHKNLAILVEQGAFRQDLYYRINVIEVKLPILDERREDILLLAEHFLQLIAQDWQLSEPLVLSAEAQQALLNHHYTGNVRELRNILERATTLCDEHIIDPIHLQLNSSSSYQNTAQLSTAYSPITNADTMPDHQPIYTSLDNRATSAPIKIHTDLHLSSAPINYQTHNDLALTQPLTNNTNDLNTSSVTKATTTEPIKALPEEGLEAYLLNQEKQLIILALNKSNWNKTEAAKLLNTTFRSLRYRMKKLEISSEDD